MPEMTVEKRIVVYDRFPDICPICHHALEPRYVTGALAGTPYSVSTYLELVFKCPRL